MHATKNPTCWRHCECTRNPTCWRHGDCTTNPKLTFSFSDTEPELSTGQPKSAVCCALLSTASGRLPVIACFMLVCTLATAPGGRTYPGVSQSRFGRSPGKSGNPDWAGIGSGPLPTAQQSAVRLPVLENVTLARAHTVYSARRPNKARSFAAGPTLAASVHTSSLIVAA